MKNLPQRYGFILIHQNKNQIIFAYLPVLLYFSPSLGRKNKLPRQENDFLPGPRALTNCFDVHHDVDTVDICNTVLLVFILPIIYIYI